jgi:hypothetical protein
MEGRRKMRGKGRKNGQVPVGRKIKGKGSYIVESNRK